MNKIFWLDTETTGLDSTSNGIIQLAGLMEINREIVDSINLYIKPFSGCVYSSGAQDVHGYTIEEIQQSDQFQSESDAIHELRSFWGKYIEHQDYTDGAMIGGYNLQFDTGFLTALWDRTVGDPGPKITHYLRMNQRLDPYMIYHFLSHRNLLTEAQSKRRLETLTNQFAHSLGIDVNELEFHDAMDDIRATRALYYTFYDEIDYLKSQRNDAHRILYKCKKMLSMYPNEQGRTKAQRYIREYFEQNNTIPHGGDES